MTVLPFPGSRQVERNARIARRQMAHTNAMLITGLRSYAVRGRISLLIGSSYLHKSLLLNLAESWIFSILQKEYFHHLRIKVCSRT